MVVLLAVILLCISATGYAQTPQWLNKPPKPIAGNNTYTFVITDSEAASLNMGRNKCFQMLSLDRGLLNTLTITYKSKDEISGHQTYNNGKFQEQLDTKSFEVITTEGKPIQLKAKIVDEYFDAKHQYMSTLYQVGTTADPIFDNVYVTSKYGAKGLWRSAIVPGWGQFHKHSYLKGGLILGGTAVLAGGIIFTEVTRADYAKKITMTHDKKAMATYANRRNNFALARNICIGATAALYIYNLVDAIVAPGARYVKVQKVDRNGRSYAFAPTVTYEGAPAATMAITF